MTSGIRSFNLGTKIFVEEDDYFEDISEFGQAKKSFDRANRIEGSQINVQIPSRVPVDRKQRRSLSLTLSSF